MQEANMTTRSVRARYHNGVLEPLDAVDLCEDQEVVLTLDADAVSKTAADWPDMYDDPDGFIRAVYQARIDGSRQPPDP